MISFSSIDSKILTLLMENGRITWSDLAAQLGISPPAVAERVRKLEERGIIKGYSAVVEPEQVGLGLRAFIFVVLERPKHRQAFLQMVQNLPQIAECHHMVGEFDYLLKVNCQDTHELEILISEQLKSLPGVIRTITNIALSCQKESMTLPVIPSPNIDRQAI